MIPKNLFKKLTRIWVGGVIMFPTAHDITPDTLPQCAAYLEQLLKPGNQVLIVTKPHLSCVAQLCMDLKPWRSQIEWRFTIGAADDALLRYWEPGAPGFIERYNAALLAGNGQGYRTSFSIEPCLDTENVVSLAMALSHLGDTIWIGKMNNVRSRVRIETEEDRRQVERIEAGQTDEKIMEIVRSLAHVPQIRWNDSIQKVIDKDGRNARTERKP